MSAVLDSVIILLAKGLVHEDIDQFVDQALPLVLHREEFGDMCRDEFGAKHFLQALFSASTGQKNLFKQLPERNAPCVCGSGKKFKTCCAPKFSTSNFPPIPMDSLCAFLANSLDEALRQQIINKPDWSLTVLIHLLPALHMVNESALIVQLYKKFVEFPKLRNNSSSMIASVLDALFNLSMDEERQSLITKLTQLKKAKSLQSIGYQRQAILASESQDFDTAKKMIKKAIQADCNQPELPFTELSSLAFSNDEPYLKARAEFWHARLRHEADPELLDWLSAVSVQGKAAFEQEMAVLDDLNNGVEMLERLMQLMDDYGLKTPYELHSKKNVAKLQLASSLKANRSTWLRSFNKTAKALGQKYDIDEQDFVTDLRWFTTDNAWLEKIISEPELLNNLEILLRLQQLIDHLPAQNHLNDLAAEIDSRCMWRLGNIVLNLSDYLSKEALHLPNNLKVNQHFWLAAQRYYEFTLECSEDGKGNDDSMMLLQAVEPLDPAPPTWLIEGLIGLLVKQNEIAKSIKMMQRWQRHTIGIRLVFVCALVQQDKLDNAYNHLMPLKGKIDFTQLQAGLKNNDLDRSRLFMSKAIQATLLLPQLRKGREWILETLA